MGGRVHSPQLFILLKYKNSIILFVKILTKFNKAFMGVIDLTLKIITY